MNFHKGQFQGALLGLATGDALGTTIEFSRRGTFTPLTNIVGGGPFNLQPGEWTDDTSMALCLGESLLTCGGINLIDQLHRYIKWWKNGSNSVTGTCFDIGNTVRSALLHFIETDDPHSGSTDPRSAGNGSIMRLAPVPLFFAFDPSMASDAAAESSRTTHGTKTAVDACRVLSELIVAALWGFNKHEILSPNILLKNTRNGLHPDIASIVEGGYKEKSSNDIRGTGYVVESLEAALWAFWNSSTFEEGALLAVNLGDDADTTGAVYGQLAGAYYGKKGIPNHWLNILAWKSRITQLADELYDHAQTTTP